MIVVIADDFTGAAEIAGIARLAGFKNVMLTMETTFSHLHADVLVVNSNTRSLSLSSAIQTTQFIAAQLLALKPAFLYLKIDSVLRGHVAAELQVYKNVLSYKAVVVMPANPTLGRTIEDGHYYVNGLLVNHTAFAHDPEFPKKSAKVTDMLGDVLPLNAVYNSEWKGWEGDFVYLTDANNKKTVETLAIATINEPLLQIGGGDYFLALLNAGLAAHKNEERAVTDSTELPPKLLVSGTTYRQSVETIDDLKKDGKPVFYLHTNVDATQPTTHEIIAAITSHSLTVIAFDQYALGTNLDAMVLRTIMAKVVTGIVTHAIALDLYIEGGATAAEILQELSCKYFTVVKTLARGVVQMQATNLPHCYITVKPGSYNWHQGF